MAKTRILTGITTTGTPHLGNYVGAIRPAIAASRNPDAESFFFLADYHALIKCDDPARIQQSTLEIAASWLACGLDPEKVYFYRQSDIPEIPELTWLLTCVTAKGLLNRAHAYKAATDANRAAGEDPDAGINAGLYMYPVLMAADILLFNANKVPVGRDQVQHIEMARDIGQRFNHIYGGEYFTLPEAAIEDNVATLPGLDGRKMSKSYNNTIPLFAGGEKALNKAIMEMVTDSSRPGSAEDAQGSALYQLIGAFADNVHEEVATAFHRSNPSQAGWGTLKKHAIESINHSIGKYRDEYEQLISNAEKIEEILQAGAKRARELAQKRIAQLREAVGLRNLRGFVKKIPKSAEQQPDEPSLQFVVFRDEDKAFAFKVLDAKKNVVVTKSGFADPKTARDAAQLAMNAVTAAS
ncbi:MAG: tryptophan--tRNA ligase [Rudaea sp.]|nr:tryptophan--tRNA ligase [Rudaea sp.]